MIISPSSQTLGEISLPVYKTLGCVYFPYAILLIQALTPSGFSWVPVPNPLDDKYSICILSHSHRELRSLRSNNHAKPTTQNNPLHHQLRERPGIYPRIQASGSLRDLANRDSARTRKL